MALPWLPNVYFSHSCPSCGHMRTATGTWFRAVRGYKCKACSGEVTLSYETKLSVLCRQQGTDTPVVPTEALNQQRPFPHKGH